jgi:hypothetical protein
MFGLLVQLASCLGHKKTPMQNLGLKITTKYEFQVRPGFIQVGEVKEGLR